MGGVERSKTETTIGEPMTTKSRPIIMSSDSMRAILDGRKTQTRRVMKPQPICYGENNAKPCYSDFFKVREYADECYVYCEKCGTACQYSVSGQDTIRHIKCPFGAPGDRLWVREKWGVTVDCETIYFADFIPNVHDVSIFRWRSPMFMLRKSSRLTLEITNVRCERVQEINNVDAILEGIEIVAFSESENETFYSSKPNFHLHAEPRNAYADRWNEINGKRKGFSWKDNPWVFVLEFKKIEGGDNEVL